MTLTLNFSTLIGILNCAKFTTIGSSIVDPEKFKETFR